MAEQAVDAAGASNGEPDPGVIRRFHFTREMIKGPVYASTSSRSIGSGTSMTSTSHRTSPIGSGSPRSSARACSA